MLYRPTDTEPRPIVRPKMTRRRKLAIAAVLLGVFGIGFLIAGGAAEQSTRDEIANVQEQTDAQVACIRAARAAGVAVGTCFRS